MLTGYSQHGKPSILEGLKTVYDGLERLGAPLNGFETFVNEVVLFFPCGGGGIVFTREKNPASEFGNDILWVHYYCPDKMPRMTSMRNMLLLASCTRASKVAAYITNPKIVSLLKRLYFRQMTEKVWVWWRK